MDQSSNIFVITGPSGAGKGTIINYVLSENSNLGFAVSTTSREPRINEIPGKDYHFVTKEQFKKLVKAGAFIEHAEFCDNLYGTTFDEISRLQQSKLDVLLDLEVCGAYNIKKIYPAATMIYIAPPNIQELERRLKLRDTEEFDTINNRINQAKFDMDQIERYDYIIKNNKITLATLALRHIMAARPGAEQFRTENQMDFVRSLKEEFVYG